MPTFGLFATYALWYYQLFMGSCYSISELYRKVFNVEIQMLVLILNRNLLHSHYECLLHQIEFLYFGVKIVENCVIFLNEDLGIRTIFYSSMKCLCIYTNTIYINHPIPSQNLNVFSCCYSKLQCMRFEYIQNPMISWISLNLEKVHISYFGWV